MKDQYQIIYKWVHDKLERAKNKGNVDREHAFKEVIATMWALDQGYWDGEGYE